MQILPPICLLVGLFAGAWLTHRGEGRKSPIPSLPMPTKKEPEAPKPFIVKP